MGVNKKESERIQREITKNGEKEGRKEVNDISSDPDENLILVLPPFSPFAATLRDANLCINIPGGRRVDRRAILPVSEWQQGFKAGSGEQSNGRGGEACVSSVGLVVSGRAAGTIGY